jgi:rhodanese-related sulfurtransferase
MTTRRWRVALSAGFAIAFLPTLVLLGQQLPNEGAVRITQQDFKTLVTAKNVVIVDTRRADEFRAGHIPGAVLLPLEGLASCPPEYEKVVASLKKATHPIVTYCA